MSGDVTDDSNTPKRQAEVNEQTRPRSSESAWQQLVVAHPRHASLNDDTLYALPHGLIVEIQRSVKGIFEKDDEAFEFDLSRLSGCGFFLREPFSYPPLSRPNVNPPQSDVSTADVAAAAADIRGMLEKDMLHRGYSQSDIDEHQDDEQKRLERIEQRMWGYSGWLVTSAEFRGARDAFRQCWEETVNELGCLPRLEMSFTGEAHTVSLPQEQREYLTDYSQFYRQWGLDHLATWELPVPMRPEMTQPSLYAYSQIVSAGLLLFVPWYMLRDRGIDVYDLAEHRKVTTGPPELASWLEGEPKNWGFDRFATMLRLYIYLELCLKPRYGDRLKGKTEELDYALGRFLCANPDELDAEIKMAESVRKIRQEMNRRLRDD